MPMSVADDLIQALGHHLMKNPKLMDTPWEQYVLVVIQTDAEKSAWGMYFDGSGNYYPATPKGFDLHDRLEEVRLVMKKPGEPAWVSCLIQITRAIGKITAQFEYNNPDRWKVTPENLNQMVEQVRPKDTG